MARKTGRKSDGDAVRLTLVVAPSFWAYKSFWELEGLKESECRHVQKLPDYQGRGNVDNIVYIGGNLDLYLDVMKYFNRN